MDIVVILAVIGLVAWLAVWFWLHAQAKQTLTGQFPMSLDQTRVIVEGAFPSLVWKNVQGPGQINKKRKTLAGAATAQARQAGGMGPTVSVGLNSVDGAETVVDVWMSAWTSQLGVPYCVGAAFRQKRKISKRLNAAATPSARVPG